MPNMFDYLRWRGDILFRQLPPNPVDALIFSSLSYIDWNGIVPDTLQGSIPLHLAAEQFLSDSEAESKVRVKEDLELVKAAAGSDRFSDVQMTFYRNIFIPEEDTQFAAVSFLLNNGTAILTFRGTDYSLTGWKEDFNMTFLESIPSQRLATEYVREFSHLNSSPLQLCGHSKGGNLAVYAAAKSGPHIQSRIKEIYNQDGPGFTEHMMEDAGYLNIVPKIHTYVPQSSVFGMLLDREESLRIIKSTNIGLMQHEPYSWEVMGCNFVRADRLTADARFLNRTFKKWLAGMTIEERCEFVDALFDLLMIEDAKQLRDLIRPQNLLSYFRNLKSDETMRKVISSELGNLIQSARKSHTDQDEP